MADSDRDLGLGPFLLPSELKSLIATSRSVRTYKHKYHIQY